MTPQEEFRAVAGQLLRPLPDLARAFARAESSVRLVTGPVLSMGSPFDVLARFAAGSGGPVTTVAGAAPGARRRAAAVPPARSRSRVTATIAPAATGPIAPYAAMRPNQAAQRPAAGAATRAVPQGVSAPNDPVGGLGGALRRATTANDPVSALGGAVQGAAAPVGARGDALRGAAGPSDPVGGLGEALRRASVPPEGGPTAFGGAALQDLLGELSRRAGAPKTAAGPLGEDGAGAHGAAPRDQAGRPTAAVAAGDRRRPFNEPIAGPVAPLAGSREAGGATVPPSPLAGPGTASGEGVAALRAPLAGPGGAVSRASALAPRQDAPGDAAHPHSAPARRATAPSGEGLAHGSGLPGEDVATHAPGPGGDLADAVRATSGTGPAANGAPDRSASAPAASAPAPYDAQVLADLVNEALVEQARLHGVDLS